MIAQPVRRGRFKDLTTTTILTATTANGEDIKTVLGKNGFDTNTVSITKLNDTSFVIEAVTCNGLTMQVEVAFPIKKECSLKFVLWNYCSREQFNVHSKDLKSQFGWDYASIGVIIDTIDRILNNDITDMKAYLDA